MPAKKRKFIILAVVAAFLLALIAWIVWGNTALELNTYTISSSKLPQSFDGYRIAHVSDLHNAEMGKNNEKLLTMLRDADPDMIAITGDLVDSRNTDIEVALQFVREAVKIAPCYYQGFFPEYDAGLYSMNHTNMIVSRGIGNSILPFRFNNRPEVIIIELKK